MNDRDTRFVELMIRLPRELLQALDTFAAAHTEGNRSQAIRMAIRQMVQGSVKSSSKNLGPKG